MGTHGKRQRIGHRTGTRTGGTITAPNATGTNTSRQVELHPKNVPTLGAPTKGAWVYVDTTPARKDAPRGFGVRVTANEVRSYVVRYRVRGGRRHMATLARVGDVTLQQARNLARKHIEGARDGRDVVAEEKARRLRGDTLAAMVEKYLASPRVRGLRTRAEYERLLKREVIPMIGAMPPGEVKKGDVRALVQKIAERSGTVGNRTLGVLQAMYSWAVKNDLLERAPAWPEPPAPESERDRVLSDDELRVIWRAIEAECEAGNLVGFGFQLMLLTAQRRGEVLRMGWQDISQEPSGTWWTIPGKYTKNGRPHRVPLTTMAVGIVEAAKAAATLRGLDTSTWVLPSDRKSKAGHVLTPSHGLERVRKRCKGVADWRPHDFRRSAATGMREAGIPRVDVAAVLNHTASSDAPRVTGIYDRWSADPEKRTALEAWERRLRAVLTGEKHKADVTPITAARA